ncbi:helix-turn-helix domain-containing protein [Saccharothrix sp.]|uniref:helix-turn-helix domain-containing protein n=1 Tax=Saccharothrix sp. TaxID=1873460 RepID=UPI0035C7FDAA
MSRQQGNRSTSSPGGPVYYRPTEVARMLRCSEWWVKEQARKRRIPFSWIGGSYLFTMEHISEIVALFEQRPGPPTAAPATTENVRSARTLKAIAGQSVARLTARTPRRAQVARGTSAA